MEESEDDLDLRVGFVEITAHVGDLAHIQLRTIVETGKPGVDRSKATRLLRREAERLLNALPVLKIKELEDSFSPEDDDLDEEGEENEEPKVMGLDKEGKPVRISRERKSERKHRDGLGKWLKNDKPSEPEQPAR